jgi:iron complex outermembrane receptor protein
MRLKTLVLCSASTVVLAVSSSPAWAQTDPAATTEAQESPADPEAAAPAEDEGDEIVVTGLRRSLQSAQNTKRNSEQIVDAIVAEDIGKLPDIAVSDTAARIPGIQVERGGGEANRVLLRGLDRTYYTTTYNGREIFTAETRSVALQDFPAGGISAIEAFKTSTATLVEPGIAGLINVRSRRPFDFQGAEIAGSVWGNYPLQSRDLSPNAQLLLSDRWDVGGGEFGALINFSYTRMHYQDSVRRHAFFIAGLAGGRSPDWPQIQYFEGDRWRPSINGALQWRPSPDLEFYVEGLWQGYRENLSDRLWEQPLWSCGADATYSNVVIENGNVISGTVKTPGCPGLTRGFQGATKRHTDTYQFAAGGRYDAGPLLITGDIARTDSTFKLRAESVDYYINTRNFSVDWFTGRPGGSGPTFQVNGLDFANPANYNYRGFFEDYLTAKGQDWQARLDAQYEPTGLDWVRNIQVGIRHVDRDASRRAGARYWDANNVGQFQIPISTVPLTYELFHPGFRYDDNRPSPTTWMAPTFDSIWDNLVALRQFNITKGIPIDQNPNRAHNNDTNPPNVVASRSFDIGERSLAGYAQLNFEIPMGSMSVDGSLGARVVRTEDSISGTLVRLPSQTPEPISVKNEYTDVLPNLNLNFHLSPEWQLRLAATKTITRPLFEQLNPALSLDPVSCIPTQPDCAITGSGGNPFLKPLRSNNFDASLEYYFSRNGFASIAAFRRDMRGFIINRTFQYPDPDPTSGLPLRITGPTNTNEGRIQGFEAQFSTFFDFLPGALRGLGAQANVTYIDAKITLPIFCPANLNPCTPGPGHDNANVIRTRIPDVSKWTYNLVGMYERGPVTLRLSYNHRSSYPEGALDERDGFYTLQGRGRAGGRLDWSSSFNVTDKFTLFFDWINILKTPFRSDIVRVNYGAGSPTGGEEFPMVVRFNESVLSGGIRFRF